MPRFCTTPATEETNMPKPQLLASAVLLLAFVPSSFGQKPSKKAPAAAPEPATIEVQPPRPGTKQIYKFDCAICHGDTGNGKTDLATSMSLTLDDWTNPASLTGKTDQQLYDIIRKGKDKMPAEDSSRAKDDEVRDLVKYIRTFASQAPAATPAAPGATPAPAATPSTAPAPPTSPSAASSSPSSN
jgi:mono/diheme cytochrome c family protein